MVENWVARKGFRATLLLPLRTEHLLLTAGRFFFPAHADDKEDVANAIKFLTEKGNYS